MFKTKRRGKGVSSRKNCSLAQLTPAPSNRYQLYVQFIFLESSTPTPFTPRRKYDEKGPHGHAGVEDVVIRGETGDDDI
jgi:hypothetical protein